MKRAQWEWPVLILLVVVQIAAFYVSNTWSYERGLAKGRLEGHQ